MIDFAPPTKPHPKSREQEIEQQLAWCAKCQRIASGPHPTLRPE